jgi:YebC/PmpR family DNA-binding regulatory protein
MSGHSKWATTKHKKAIIDKRRAKVFAKLIKAIEVTARTGGADPSGNPTLYDAIQKARKNSVPSDNIDRAVKRGAGLESGGAAYETIIYEGYGPQGVALLIECLSDNRNRAASEVRVAVTRNGGTMADPGSVSYLFHRRGVVIVGKEQRSGEKAAPQTLSEDNLMEIVLDAGAEEINDLGLSYEVVSEPSAMVSVRSAVESAGWEYESAEVSLLPSVSVPVDKDGAEKLFQLIEAIEELDDVQNVYANFDVSDEIMAALS